MKSLNLRTLAMAALGLAVVGTAVHWLHGFQVRRNADMFLRQAERAEESGRLHEAIQKLQWYVALKPEDIDAVADLGLLLADVSAHGPAYQALEKVLRTDARRPEIRRQLAVVAIELHRFADARVHLERLLENSPNDAELLAQLGRCCAATRDYARAAELYEKALRGEPHRIALYAPMVAILRVELKRPDDADRWIETLIRANPDSAQAHVVRAGHLKATARIEGAAEAAAEALRIDPENPHALLLAAQCATELETFDDALEYATRLVELRPDVVAAYALLADIETRSKNVPNAIAWVNRGLDAHPGQVDLLWTLGLLLVEQSRCAEAEEVVRQLGEAKYPPSRVGYLQARSELAQENWLAARQHFEKVAPMASAWPDLSKRIDFYLGQCYRELGDADRQLTAYRRAVTGDPFWVPARHGLAQALLAVGRMEEALEELRVMMSTSGAPATGWVQLTGLTILKNLRLDPADRDWAYAARLLELAERANPDDPTVVVLQAEALVGQDHVEDARRLLHDSWKARPNSPEIPLALVGLEQRQRDWDQAEQLLEQVTQGIGDSVTLRLARAQHLVRRHGKEAADKLRPLAENVEALPTADMPELWSGLAVQSIRTQDYNHARRLCRRLAEAEPNNLRAWLVLYDLALRARDDRDMDRVLGEVNRIEGQGPLWQYGRALYLALQDDPKLLPQALSLLASAAAARPVWSRVPLLAATVYDQQGEEEDALEHYVEAIKLGERDPTAVQRAIQLLADRQRFFEADQLIRRIEQHRTPFSSGLARIAAEVSLRLEDFDRALEMARHAASESREYRDHAWLGLVLEILGQRAKRQGQEDDSTSAFVEAEKEMRRAIELAPKEAESWVTLLGFLARTGQDEKFDQAALAAQKNLPADVAPLALAQCYESLGRIADAEEHYQRALAAAASDPNVVRQVAAFYLRSGKTQPAETQLRRITEGEIGGTTEELSWARRRLALVRADRGGYANLVRGLALLDENLSGANPDVEDQRAKAVLLSSHPERRKREQAIGLLESLVQRRRAAAKDRFVLAKLYLARGDWANASRHMRSLLASHGTHVDYVTAYVEMLLAHEEIQEAELWLRRLTALTPDSLSTARLRAWLLYHRGQHDQAAAALIDFAELQQADSKDAQVRVGLVAGCLAELAMRARRSGDSATTSQYMQQAETLYRRHMGERPERAMLLAAFLARAERIQDALDLAEQGWRDCSAELLAAMLVVLFQETNAAPAEVERAEALLASGLEEHGRPVPLLTVLADLRTLQERFADAEKVYREILTKAPDDVMALNNLALLLALQGREPDRAKELIDRAWEISGPTPGILDSRATVLLTQGKPQEALEDVERALRDTSAAPLYFHKAQACLELGQRAAARQAFAKARRIDFRGKTINALERPAYERLRAALRSGATHGE